MAILNRIQRVERVDFIPKFTTVNVILSRVKDGIGSDHKTVEMSIFTWLGVAVCFTSYKKIRDMVNEPN